MSPAVVFPLPTCTGTFRANKNRKKPETNRISFWGTPMEQHSATNSDIYIFSESNLLAQLEHAPMHLGYKTVRFYVDNDGVVAKENTGTTDIFYLSPSGGTLRDKHLNIVLYSARYDIYKDLAKQKK